MSNSSLNPDPIFPSAPNFRDIGGIDVGNGHRTVCRRLYRSQMLRGFSARDLAHLPSLGLVWVHDLRGPDERQSTPHEYLGDEMEIRARDGGGDASAVNIMRWRERLLQGDFDADAAHRALTENYQRMPLALGPELAALCQRLADRPEGAVLVHCSVGKDRTGFIMAALLRILEVPEQAILQDYLKSGPLLAGQLQMIEHHRQKLFGQLPERAEPAFRMMLSTHPDFLNASYAVIDEHYGSFAGYLAAIGVDTRVIQGLRAHLLESAGESEE